MGGDLPAGSTLVIQTLVVLDVPVSTDELAAAAGMPEPDARATVTVLVQRGWLHQVKSGRYALPKLRPGDSPETGGLVDAQEVRRRFGEYLLGGVRAALHVQGKFSAQLWERRAAALPTVRFVDPGEAAAWLRDHQANLVAAIRIGAQHGLSELAAQLAVAVWEAAPDDLDPKWFRELSRWGEEAAISWRHPQFLATLLDHSARCLRRATDMQGAESQWVRALHIGRRSRDYGIAVTALSSLSELYGEWSRPHRKLDAELELLAWQQRAGNPLDVVRARVRLGSTLLAADRASAAVEHLLQAEQELGALGETAEAERAAVLVKLGRAHWQLGATDTARRCFSQALAILLDRDPAGADRIRELLRTEDDHPLPAPNSSA